MKRRRYGIVLAAMAVASAGVLHAEDISQYERIEPSAKELAKLKALTPQDFENSADVADDDLETIAKITTAPGYRSNGRFTDRVRADNFLRAFITKRDGSVGYQVYQRVTYTTEWRDFSGVNYATPDGPVSAKIDVLSHDVTSCASGMCVYQDVIAFDVSEAVLKAIASQYVPGNSPFWRFRFSARNGMSWEDRMTPAEVAGLLAKVRAWRQAHGFTKP